MTDYSEPCYVSKLRLYVVKRILGSNEHMVQVWQSSQHASLANRTSVDQSRL